MAETQNATQPASAAARCGRRLTSCSECSPSAADKDRQEKSSDQNQADDSKLPKRLQVDGVGVADEACNVTVARPPVLERARTGSSQRFRLLLLDGGTPVLVTPVAAEALQSFGTAGGAVCFP